ncbi:MAG: hypothetical protein A2Y10_03895 [Planctomycetes bacterium GWF2_41_51]|nr:MAG: hypothetical protein A2Y10_03895 [Planctomycetes bacterium GWF2_41_51]HBG26017.1 hypothetical protein [Phycisphaerales bacterium]
MHKLKKKSGFTLVELLVVISIIAMLLAVLMPALSTARNSARVIMCAANIKEIGYLIPLYRADNNNEVPKLAQKYYELAKYAYLSAAFKNYVPELRNLPPELNITIPWTTSQYQVYAEKYVPKYFVCPFATAGIPKIDRQSAGSIELNGQRLGLFKRVGSDDSYVTQRFITLKDTVTNQVGWSGEHPLGSPFGTPEYGELNWFNPLDIGKIKAKDTPLWVWENSIRAAKWDSEQIKKAGGSSQSDVMVLMCDRGQHCARVGTVNSINNYGSHKKGGKGGTNILFGDLHAGWVNGHRVGW